MSTVNQRSRQQRALAQRQRELDAYKEMEVLPEEGNCRKRTDPEDKAVKAAKDVMNLTRKLSQRAQD